MTHKNQFKHCRIWPAKLYCKTNKCYNMKTIASILSRNMHGYCPRTLSVLRCEQFSKSFALGNCAFRRTSNIQGQMYKNIFVQNREYCVYYLSNILHRGWTDEQLFFHGGGCFIWSVLWYGSMNKQMLSLFCNNYETLSTWNKFETETYRNGYKVWNLGNITREIDSLSWKKFCHTMR